MTSLPVAGFAGHPGMSQAGNAGTVGERMCCLLLLCQEVLWYKGWRVACRDRQWGKTEGDEGNPEYLELAVRRDAQLGDKLPIPARHPAVGTVLSAWREPGFWFATGRTSMVCAALSTLVPQGISSVSWSNWVDCQPAETALS